MADKNIQMTQRNTANDGWDNLYPKTKAANVVAADGATTFESHLTDYEYQIPTLSGTQIRLTRASNTRRLGFYLSSNLSGGNITISLDAGVTSAPLKDYDGNQLTSLSKGYHEVVDNTTFFTYAPKGGSNIKSIQRGSATFSTASSTTKAITISQIDMSKSIVYLEGCIIQDDASGALASIPRIEITNSTTITATKKSTAYNIVFYWVVIEFKDVKSIQKGLSTELYCTAGTSNTYNISISAVNTAKSQVFYSFSSLSNNWRGTRNAVTLASSTQLNIIIPNTSISAYSQDVDWNVVEFK